MTDTEAGPTTAEATGLILREARLIDERRFEEWLELFTDDGLYWLPIDEGAGDATISTVLDDAERRGERVFRLLHTPVPAQTPPSRTVHMVSGVELAGLTEHGDAVVHCVLLVGEIRPGGPLQLGLGQQQLLLGRCEYHLRRVGGDWKIALKKVMLLNADRPIGNLTFIV